MEEAQAIELEIAKKAGWENEKDAEEYGYGDYGFNEDYFIDLHMLKDDAVVKVGGGMLFTTKGFTALVSGQTHRTCICFKYDEYTVGRFKTYYPTVYYEKECSFF